MALSLICRGICPAGVGTVPHGGGCPGVKGPAPQPISMSEAHVCTDVSAVKRWSGRRRVLFAAAPESTPRRDPPWRPLLAHRGGGSAPPGDAVHVADEGRRLPRHVTAAFTASLRVGSPGASPGAEVAGTPAAMFPGAERQRPRLAERRRQQDPCTGRRTPDRTGSGASAGRGGIRSPGYAPATVEQPTPELRQVNDDATTPAQSARRRRACLPWGGAATPRVSGLNPRPTWVRPALAGGRKDTASPSLVTCSTVRALCAPRPSTFQASRPRLIRG